MKQITTSIIALAIGLVPANILAQTAYPEGFTEEVVYTDFFFNAGTVHADSTRLFVWELDGKVWLINDGVVLPEPVIDISEEVGFWGDHGLIGLALDPSFLSNGYIYLLYNVDLHYLRHFGTPEYDPSASIEYQGGMGRITRYTLNTVNFETIIPGSRHIVLGGAVGEGVPITAQSHGIGSLVFGDDGSLLISTGDGNSFICCYNGEGPTPEAGYDEASIQEGLLRPSEHVGAFRSQSVNGLHGKVLRIDPASGEGLPGNPFYEADSAHLDRSRIWALGLRNPFRMSLKPGTGSGTLQDGYPGVLYVCDVGEGEWEELNVVKDGGENFGWPIYQGPEKYSAYSELLTANPHAPNPLYDGGVCGAPLFNFQDLIVQENAPHQYIYPNPCSPDQVISNSQVKFAHTRGIVNYRNRWSGPPSILLPDYDATGDAIAVQISENQGASFAGVSGAGGVFLHGDKIPETYKGRFVMADYDGWVRAFEFDENEALITAEVWSDSIGRPVHLSFKASEGCIYLTSLFPSFVKRICFGGNLKPVVVASPGLSYGPAPLQVEFDASLSYDPEGGPLDYLWDFGDGSPQASGYQVSHTFGAGQDQAILYTVRLVVSDTAGASSTADLRVSINNTPPIASVLSVEEGELYSLDKSTIFNLLAGIQDAEHSPAQMIVEWQVNLRHNDHFHLITTLTGNDQEIYVRPTSCAENEVYWYEIVLKVTDPGGLSDSKSVMIYPDCDEVLDGDNSLNDRAYVLLPNPATNMLALRSNIDMQGALEYQIVDAKGITARAGAIQVFNERLYIQFPIDDLPSGLYILSFRLGDIWMQERFIKMDE